MANLNPGIREVVAWLNKHGFRTTDSGDGKTHDYECDRDYPYVVIRIPDAPRLVYETNRLFLLLVDLGIRARPIGREPGAVEIQASYDPGNSTAVIDVMGLDDARLCAARKEGGHG